MVHSHIWGFPGGSGVKNLPALQETEEAQVQSLGQEAGRSPGGGHGNPLQYSSLENPMDRGAWRATVHRTAKSWTRLKDLSSTQARSHAYPIVSVTRTSLTVLTCSS